MDDRKRKRNVHKSKGKKPKHFDASAEEVELEQKKSSGSKSPAVNGNAKILRSQKKDAISNLKELQGILGVSKDVEEKVLEKFIFGCDAADLNDLENPPSEEEKEIEESKPAWEDEDDDNILVEEKAAVLKNCHRSVSSRGKEKYSEYIQEKFKKVIGQPKWADLETKEDSDADSEDELLQKTGNIVEPSKSLPKGTIQIQKCPSLVDESMKNAFIKSVEFHPSARVALVGGTSGTANLFQIDGKINAKIQSVHFKNFPVHAAHFSVDGNEIVVGSNKYGHYFSYDMMSGKVVRIPWDKGMEQQNIRRFQMSPDGKYIVIQGRYGYIHFVTAKSKEWIGSVKMNGEVVSIAFSNDGSKMYSHGDTGEIYVWDMKSRKCIHKFTDEGCIIGSSITVSPNGQFLAAGSDSGIVNIYDNSTVFASNSPKPLKVLMNLTTEVTHMKFNSTSELLAISSSHKQNALKLVHCPSMTVFANFPGRNDHSTLKCINSLDISVNSGYFCLGNNLSTVHIYRLKHYHNY